MILIYDMDSAGFSCGVFCFIGKRSSVYHLGRMRSILRIGAVERSIFCKVKRFLLLFFHSML